MKQKLLKKIKLQKKLFLLKKLRVKIIYLKKGFFKKENLK